MRGVDGDTCAVSGVLIGYARIFTYKQDLTADRDAQPGAARAPCTSTGSADRDLRPDRLSPTSVRRCQSEGTSDAAARWEACAATSAARIDAGTSPPACSRHHPCPDNGSDWIGS